MDIFFTDPSEIPLPAAEVRIRELRAELLAGSKKVKVYLEIDPFQVKPNADLIICNDKGEEFATTSIIESNVRKMELTMHLHGNSPPGIYYLHATLYFAKINDSNPDEGTIEQNVVDKQKLSFEIV
jgi:hypothetical protein